ncbi:MAG: hypothetical protein H0U92_13230 [Actinobacteria bacterium]|nr:hypothetical protein [Actinomycetota bacterium]
MSAVLAWMTPSANAQDNVASDDIAAPEVFSGNASATGVSIGANREALLPIEDLFKFIALDGKSVYSSSTHSARASLLFPGNGLILGPSLACGTFGGQFPPEFKPILDTCLQYKYPLSVTADDFQPDAATSGSLVLGTPTEDISGEAILAKAHAADDASTTDAVINSLRVAGIPPFGPLNIPVPQLQLDGSVFSADSSSARTDQRIVKGELVTDAKATLSGLRLLGGLIGIGNIVSESRITDNGQGARSAAADLDITGVTVAGQPAKITNKGIVVNDPKNPTPLDKALFDQANNVLKQFDVKISVLPTEEKLANGGPASATVGGLLLEFSRDVQGLPLLPSPIGGELDPNGRYTVTVQLASTGANGSAANFGSDGENGGLTDNLLDTGGDSLDASGGDLGGFADGASFDSGNLNADGSSGGSDVGGTAKDAGRSGGPRALASNVANNFGGRLGLLYLAMVLSVLALCISPRLALTARLPGPKK